MNELQTEFVPYDLSLKMKALGFDEPCFAWYDEDIYLFTVREQDDIYDYWTPAPTFSQCFRWFREKYDLYHSIGLDNSLENDVNCNYQIINHSQSISELETDFKTYEEAELACLEKLIEIVESKNKTI